MNYLSTKARPNQHACLEALCLIDDEPTGSVIPTDGAKRSKADIDREAGTKYIYILKMNRG